MKEQRSFNPFVELFETSTFPHARTLRTSLWQKFVDAFYVISGFTNTRKHHGLLDYATLFIPRVFSGILKSMGSIKTDSVAAIPALVLVLIHKTVIKPLRALTAGLLVFLASPVILLTHLVSRFVDSSRVAFC